MSYHALMQPSLMHNYYEDFGDCLLIDNGRVTPQFQQFICANLLVTGRVCRDSVFIKSYRTWLYNRDIQNHQGLLRIIH